VTLRSLPQALALSNPALSNPALSNPSLIPDGWYASRPDLRQPSAPSAPLRLPLRASAATKAEGPALGKVAVAVARKGHKVHQQVKLPVHYQQAAGVQHVPETRSSKRVAALKSSSGVVANLSRWR
jgi:hypothetical protein